MILFVYFTSLTSETKVVIDGLVVALIRPWDLIKVSIIKKCLHYRPHTSLHHQEKETPSIYSHITVKVKQPALSFSAR